MTQRRFTLLLLLFALFIVASVSTCVWQIEKDRQRRARQIHAR